MTTSRARKLPAADDVALGYYHVSSQLLARAFVASGYPVEWLNKNTFVADVHGHDVGFSVTRGPCVSTFASHVTTRKDFTHTFLARAGLEVASGRAFPADKHDRARAYAEKLGWPVVVKPSRGSAGRGITLGVRAETFEEAWASATERDGSVMVESYFPGAEARFVVVGDRCVAAAGKCPPSVVGDGTSTLAELVEAKNARRRAKPLYEKRPITLTDSRIDALARRGYPLDQVLAADVELTLDGTGNLSTGAEAVDLTDDVHSTFHEVAAQAAHSVPGLGIAGVDIIAADFDAPAEPGNYIVCEMNSWPGIASHHLPSRGQPRDVAGAIVAHVVDQLPQPTPWWRSWLHGGTRSSSA